MKPPRDSNRKRLYTAEEMAFDGDRDYGQEFSHVEAIRQWYRRVKERIFLDDLTIKRAHGNCTACRAEHDEQTIYLTDSGLYMQIVLHEIAHLVTGPKYPSHGKEFCWNYLDLTLEFRGQSTYRVLRDAMRAQGII